MRFPTRGPWRTYKQPEKNTWLIAAPEIIASEVRLEDDAILIAAAPELLKVCKMLLADAKGLSSPSFVLATQLINRIEGREPDANPCNVCHGAGCPECWRE